MMINDDDDSWTCLQPNTLNLCVSRYQYCSLVYISMGFGGNLLQTLGGTDLAPSAEIFFYHPQLSASVGTLI